VSEKRHQASQNENLHEMTGQDIGIWMYYEKSRHAERTKSKSTFGACKSVCVNSLPKTSQASGLETRS